MFWKILGVCVQSKHLLFRFKVCRQAGQGGQGCCAFQMGSQRRTEPAKTFPFEGELCSAVCCPYAWWEGRSETLEMMSKGSPRLSAGRVSSLPYKGFLPLT